MGVFAAGSLPLVESGLASWQCVAFVAALFEYGIAQLSSTIHRFCQKFVMASFVQATRSVVKWSELRRPCVHHTSNTTAPRRERLFVDPQQVIEQCRTGTGV